MRFPLSSDENGLRLQAGEEAFPVVRGASGRIARLSGGFEIEKQARVGYKYQSYQKGFFG